MQKILFLCAALSIAAVIMICLFVFIEGYPIIQKVGFFNFVFGQKWSPSEGLYGILPMIMGTFTTTLGAIVLGVPLSIFTAIFLVEYAPKKVKKLINPAIELLAGIPSVIYGLFGMTMVVPIIREFQKACFGIKQSQIQSGYSILAASIILSIMISPTIINITSDALKSVEHDLKEGSLALGATDWQTTWHIILPTAKSGIIAGVVLGMGRAIGETMAVIMVAGNTVGFPKSIFSPVRSLTGNIAIEMAYAAAGDHMQALFGTGIVLFILIMVINIFALRIYEKGVKVK
ncbi:Phosphate ABC transporter, inner membrane subunit PstC [Tepidanaerobacter acetatoxydans Re1]|uniref:Phosphate ABC transporter, inner membrane subunit PstC n=1 Tax=Tepidanaerobacter acetatoxydans (strain DSM 21804 / JCM 16047 / Re1) TaxID=1209989 RepID=F4LRR1_TEPAE|nr:phosphate ABC transporter permease subunit PstC [Tepidanaerobacter acetatoxydans]AEE91129.1 phosphate ABC transporter, inner membrane subunit PstC [Tepidanaerobacter acetatoxydans Re1]CCP25794.1 Phosphate ABC transporter, inner membrane subunit PstC [Tepidanaerobacter acetatoxydans Re1]